MGICATADSIPCPETHHTLQEKLRVEFERSQQDRLAEQQKELQNVFILEKQDLLQKYESKKNLLNQEHDREKEELLNRWVNIDAPM